MVFARRKSWGKLYAHDPHAREMGYVSQMRKKAINNPGPILTVTSQSHIHSRVNLLSGSLLPLTGQSKNSNSYTIFQSSDDAAADRAPEG